jgi:hypothetical protein
MAEEKLSLEQRIERIERALFVQGLLERPAPVVSTTKINKTVGRKSEWLWAEGTNFWSVLVTFNCACGKVHRQPVLIPPSASKSGQFFAVRGECGQNNAVLIEKED